MMLLAAGQSKRFKGIKQLADVHGQPMICHCLSQYRKNNHWIDGITNGTVMLGANADLIAKVLPCNIDNYVATSWHLGMGHTLAEGIQKVSGDATHVLIALADQVLLTQQHIQQLLNATRRYPEHIIASQYAKKAGAPSIFPKHYFNELIGLTGDNGAKGLLGKYSQQIIRIAMPEAAFDVDTPQDLGLI